MLTNHHKILSGLKGAENLAGVQKYCMYTLQHTYIILYLDTAKSIKKKFKFVNPAAITKQKLLCNISLNKWINGGKMHSVDLFSFFLKHN